MPKRAAALIPDARLLYIMRDPIARLRSDYIHDWRNGRERRPFAEAVLAEDSVHLVTSCYALQIEQWLAYYDREQLLLLTIEELAADRAGVMARVYAHVGVDPTFVPDPEQRNTAETSRYMRAPFLQLRGTRLGRSVVRKLPRSLTDVPPPEAVVTPALRAELVDRLAPDVARLREWLPDSFDGWGIG